MTRPEFYDEPGKVVDLTAPLREWVNPPRLVAVCTVAKRDGRLAEYLADRTPEAALLGVTAGPPPAPPSSRTPAQDWGVEEKMNRNEFEKASREQNQHRNEEVAEARAIGSPCDLEVMLAFGGVSYCLTHGVVGSCPYGKEARS